MQPLLLELRHKSPCINVFGYATMLSPYFSICMYLYSRERHNMHIPSILVYILIYELHLALYVIIMSKHFAFYLSFASLTNHLVLVPYCLQVCQIWEIELPRCHLNLLQLLYITHLSQG